MLKTKTKRSHTKALRHRENLKKNFTAKSAEKENPRKQKIIVFYLCVLRGFV